MRRFIVVSHAYMAQGIVSSLELIAGKQPNLTYHCAYVEANNPYQVELIKEIESYPVDDEIVIFTDLFGGSVNNEIMALTNQYANIHLVTGMNLLLLLSIMLASKAEDISKVINDNIEQARSGIIYCNELSKGEDGRSLDEF